MGNASALERFERQTAIPMLVLSLLVIPLLVLPLLLDLSSGAEAMVLRLDWMLWGLFAAEYGVRLTLAPSKWAFVRSNKVDLLVVILPFLRPLRVVRSARSMRLLRAARASTLLGRAFSVVVEVLTRRSLHYALAFGIVIVFVAGLLVYEFEHGQAGANINDLADALWWAVTTVTTVGYGDTFPTTAAGRGVGVALMLAGVAVFGFLAGNLASFFLERRHKQEEDDLVAIKQQLDRLEEKLERLER